MKFETSRKLWLLNTYIFFYLPVVLIKISNEEWKMLNYNNLYACFRSVNSSNRALQEDELKYVYSCVYGCVFYSMSDGEHALVAAPWHIVRFYFAENTVTMPSTAVSGTSPTSKPLSNSVHEETDRSIGCAYAATSRCAVTKQPLCQ